MPLRSETIFLLFSVLLLDNRDFLFYPIAQANQTLFAHIINYKLTKVLVRNISDWPLCILPQHRLGYAIIIYYNNCFFIKAKSTLHNAIFSKKALPFFEHEFFYILIPLDPFIKTRLDNGVKIYGDKQVIALLTQLVGKYLTIGKFGGFIQILPKG